MNIVLLVIGVVAAILGIIIRVLTKDTDYEKDGKYYMKPSERTIRTALMSLHDMVKAYGIKKNGHATDWVWVGPNGLE